MPEGLQNAVRSAKHGTLHQRQPTGWGRLLQSLAVCSGPPRGGAGIQAATLGAELSPSSLPWVAAVLVALPEQMRHRAGFVCVMVVKPGRIQTAFWVIDKK